MGVPISPMHRPTVGSLLFCISSQHPQVVVRMVGHRGELDDVGVERGQPGVHFFQILGRLAEVVQADDPLGLAVAGDRRRDVFFEVDVFDPLGDGRAQQHAALLFAAAVLAAVVRPPAGDDHGAGPIGKQTLEVDVAVDVVQPQFDQLGALVDQMLVFRDDVPMTAAADADANHRSRVVGWSASRTADFVAQAPSRSESPLIVV